MAKKRADHGIWNEMFVNLGCVCGFFGGGIYFVQNGRRIYACQMLAFSRSYYLEFHYSLLLGRNENSMNNV